MKKVKKILFVTGRISGGGAERVLVTLANEFFHRNYIVHIAQLEKDIEQPYDLMEGIQRHVANLNGTGIKRVHEIVCFLRKLIRKEEYSSIISFQLGVNVCSLIAGIGLNVPIIVSERCDPGNITRSNDKFFYYLSRYLYRRAKGIVFQTEYVKKYYSDAVNQKSRIIMNPIVDLPIRDKLEIRPWVLNVGRLSPQKNQRLLIDSFAEFHKIHPEYELHILGEGELKEELLNQIKKADLSECVYIHGFVKDVVSYYRVAKLFVLTSDYEGIPNAMLEAMAVGVPVICTDCPVGGVRQVVKQNVNGILVGIGEREKIVTAMKMLAEDSSMYQKISNAATKIRNDYSLQIIVDEWEKCINGK